MGKSTNSLVRKKSPRRRGPASKMPQVSKIKRDKIDEKINHSKKNITEEEKKDEKRSTETTSSTVIDSPSRPVRKRMMSKRLQDMEVDFGGMKRNASKLIENSSPAKKLKTQPKKTKDTKSAPLEKMPTKKIVTETNDKTSTEDKQNLQTENKTSIEAKQDVQKENPVKNTTKLDKDATKNTDTVKNSKNSSEENDNNTTGQIVGKSENLKIVYPSQCMDRPASSQISENVRVITLPQEKGTVQNVEKKTVENSAEQNEKTDRKDKPEDETKSGDIVEKRSNSQEDVSPQKRKLLTLLTESQENVQEIKQKSSKDEKEIKDVVKSPAIGVKSKQTVPTITVTPIKAGRVMVSPQSGMAGVAVNKSDTSVSDGKKIGCLDTGTLGSANAGNVSSPNAGTVGSPNIGTSSSENIITAINIPQQNEEKEISESVIEKITGNDIDLNQTTHIIDLALAWKDSKITSATQPRTMLKLVPGTSTEIPVKMVQEDSETFLDNIQHEPKNIPAQGRDNEGPKPDQDGNFLCEKCAYKTSKKANLYKHRKVHMGIKPHQCPECDYQASTSSNLKRHALIHVNSRQFKCDICPMTFRQKIHLERHVSYKHMEKKIKCSYCDYRCANYNPDLKAHVARRHSFEERGPEHAPRYTCQVCNFCAANVRDLKQHQKFHKSGPELKLYCEHCSFVTDCESRLKRHLLTHTKEKPYACGCCDYKATQKEHVIRHMTAKHNLSCPKKRTVRKKVPANATQTSEGSLTAVSTGNASGFQPQLKIIMGEQGGLMVNEMDKKQTQTTDFAGREKLFSCSHCTMKFSKLINLYKHVQVQHRDLQQLVQEDGAMVCLMCDYKSQRKKNLLVHMRKHNYRDTELGMNQMYSCMICQYTSLYRKSLYIHMRKRHKMKIVMQADGVSSCVIADGDAGDATDSVAEEDDTDTSQEQIMYKNAAGELQVIEDASGTIGNVLSIAEGQETADENTTKSPRKPQMVQVDMPDGGSQLVEIYAPPQRSTIEDIEAVDAAEGLQALAQQIHLASSASNPQPEQPKIKSDSGEVHLSADQFKYLSTGDFIEINGEMYKVEFSTDEPGTGTGTGTGTGGAEAKT